MGNFVDIASRLKGERERLGLTQTEMASHAGVGRKTQFNYETGERFPDAAYLAAVDGLGVDVQYVVTGRPAATPRGIALKDGEASLLESYRALDKRGQAAVLAVIATMSPSDPSSKGRTKTPSQQQSIGVHVTQHAHGNDTTQVGSVRSLKIIKKSK